MEIFENLAKDYFGEIVINKALIHQAGFGNRAIPTYVGEWIISHFIGDDQTLTNDNRERIADFIQKFVPAKGQKEAIKNQLYEQEEVRFLDNFSVYVNLAKGDRYLNIPFLDESSAFTSPKIIEDNDMLLSSGLWGVGNLFYIPPSDENPKGQIWMKEFKAFQLANVDLDYFIESRKNFSSDEWINLIVSSMGFNHELYNDRQKLILISRLIPIVEPRFNLVEPAPKGTGKSFVFDNMSRYVAVRAGSISPAVLFFNDSRKTPGLITRYDCVVIDEAQKVKADSSGELTALLKAYLEAGKFGRGSAGSISAEAGLVLLANIDIDENRQPVNNEIGLFRSFPNFLRETAFIDRFSGLLPGWDLPRISKKTPSTNLGFKGDIFGEILHSLRSDVSYKDYVKTYMDLIDCDDMRDTKAIEAGASGLLKIIFPDKNPSEEDFYKYCVNPAIELRQRIKDELCKLDREYIPGTIYSKHPDNFQKNHKLPKYYEIDDNTIIKSAIKSDQALTKLTEVEDKINDFDTLDPNRKPSTTTIRIKHNDVGYSYKNLFLPYIREAKHIIIVDPYIRNDYQIKNLVAFLETLERSKQPVAVHLITTPSDKNKENQTYKLEDIKMNLADHEIYFTYEFNDTIHDRYIEIDTIWRIKLGRGLDIFQKPESSYTIGIFDQTKRKCRETEIDYTRF